MHEFERYLQCVRIALWAEMCNDTCHKSNIIIALYDFIHVSYITHIQNNEGKESMQKLKIKYIKQQQR